MKLHTLIEIMDWVWNFTPGYKNFIKGTQFHILEQIAYPGTNCIPWYKLHTLVQIAYPGTKFIPRNKVQIASLTLGCFWQTLTPVSLRPLSWPLSSFPPPDSSVGFWKRFDKIYKLVISCQRRWSERILFGFLHTTARTRGWWGDEISYCLVT
jgi:hypothetical protein